jgi:hypothetical protein
VQAHRAPRTLALAVIATVCCGKGAADQQAPAATKTAAAGEASGDRKAEPSGAGGASGEAAKAEPAAPTQGLAIQHVVPEFTGTYDRVLAQLTNGTDPTVIAFVRGCPKLGCDVGAWEPEQVAHSCPKAYIATVTIATDKPGRWHKPLAFAGPAEHAATASLDDVSWELTRVERDGIEGTARQHTTESAVAGRFVAEVCPRN